MHEVQVEVLVVLLTDVAQNAVDPGFEMRIIHLLTLCNLT